MVKPSDGKAMAMVQLHEHLFVRSHTRFIHANKVLDALVNAQIRFVLNVALINDPILAAACRTVGINYRHEPLRDSQREPIPGIVTELIKLVAELIPTTGVLVHCDSGWNRSNLIAIPALARYTQRSPAELVNEIRVHRPKTLKNPRFESFVLKGSYLG